MRKQVWRIARLAPLVGVLFANGCLLAAQNTLELLFAPSAFDNAQALPFSAVGQVLGRLIQLGLR